MGSHFDPSRSPSIKRKRLARPRKRSTKSRGVLDVDYLNHIKTLSRQSWHKDVPGEGLAIGVYLENNLSRLPP